MSDEHLNVSQEDDEGPTNTDDELPYSSKKKNVSNLQAFSNLIKTNFGIGILGLPLAMSRAGILFGPTCGLLLFLVSYHCQVMIIQSAEKVQQSYNKKVIGYAGTCKYALTGVLGSKSKYVAYLVNAFIVVNQLGGCAAYIVFSSQSLFSVSEYMFGDVRYWIAILISLILMPALFCVLEIMSILSTCSNVLSVVGLFSTFAYLCMNLQTPTDLPLITNGYSIFLYISTVMFISKGTTAILPIRNEMENSKDFNKILVISSSFSIMFYMLFSLCGYCAFKDKLIGAVTLNLPDSTFYNTVKIIYALAIVLTFFIQFYIPLTVMLPTVVKITSDPKKKLIIEFCFRFFLLAIISCCAFLIPNIDNMISLIGSFTCGALLYVFPSIIHLALFWNEYQNRLHSFIIRTKDILILLWGLVATIISVYASVKHSFISH